MEIEREALIESFVSESHELLATIENTLLQIEGGAVDRETSEVLLRAAHTMKGNASCVSFDALTEYVHEFEDVLSAVISSGSAGSDVVTELLRAVDAMRAAAVAEGRLANDAAAILENAARLAEAASEPRAATDVRGDASAHTAVRSIRVATSKLDRMVNLAGELAIARGRVSTAVGNHQGASAELVEAISDADRLNQELQELVMSLRMVPVGPEIQRFHRTVRDLAAANGKLAQLVVEGGDVEIDTAVVNALRDPLTHMLRNAIDHGIEPPDVRELAGKRRVATIKVRARHNGGRIVVSIEDDGAGLDVERIVARARQLGLVGAHEHVDPRAATQLIFEHGFSTARQTSDLSGRGVGMDVVRRSVEALRGTIDVSSVAGAGTRFTIHLPLTLAIIDGFAVSAGGETYIVPLDSVVECGDFPSAADRSGEQGLLNLRGEAVPFIRLRQHLGIAADVGTHESDREAVVIVSHDAGRVGLCADRVIGKIQTVIKPLGFLRGIRGISAAAILGSGDVALILDVPQLIDTARQTNARRGRAA